MVAEIVYIGYCGIRGTAEIRGETIHVPLSGVTLQVIAKQQT